MIKVGDWHLTLHFLHNIHSNWKTEAWSSDLQFFQPDWYAYYWFYVQEKNIKQETNSIAIFSAVQTNKYILRYWHFSTFDNNKMLNFFGGIFMFGVNPPPETTSCIQYYPLKADSYENRIFEKERRKMMLPILTIKSFLVRLSFMLLFMNEER